MVPTAKCCKHFDTLCRLMGGLTGFTGNNFDIDSV